MVLTNLKAGVKLKVICTLSISVIKEVLTYSWVGNQCLYVCSLRVQIVLLLLQLPRQLCEETVMVTVKTQGGRKKSSKL